MPVRFAERMQRLGTEGAFEVLARARGLEAKGRDIVHLEIGEPDFATPDNITEAAVSALHAGFTHYTPAGGIMEARAAVGGFVTRRLGVETDPLEVVLVPGSKNVLLFVLLACVEPGDEVIYPDRSTGRWSTSWVPSPSRSGFARSGTSAWTWTSWKPWSPRGPGC
jgi:aspartate aminotransferase